MQNFTKKNQCIKILETVLDQFSDNLYQNFINLRSRKATCTQKWAYMYK